jgi:bifunctional non-homologous end joining protein LigD
VDGKPQEREVRTHVKLTHPDRLLWPQAGITKSALADYYARVWSLIAPHITARPLALVRCPNGVDQGCFFQKHQWQGSDEHIIPVNDPEDRNALVSIADLDGLIALVQASVLEIHPWGSASKSLGTPDRLIFDLDPGEKINWSDLAAAAKALRNRLRDDGLESFVKTSGGKGLHVVFPVVPRASWEEAKSYCRSIAQAMAADNPQRLTANMSKRERSGRIYVDYLRNDRGSTAIAAYSTRARPEAGISTPLDWNELDTISSAKHFTLANVARRLQNLHGDPWQAMAKTKQRLPRKSRSHI